METAAHEIGHEILNDSYGVFGYSWIHKGSASICQNPNKHALSYKYMGVLYGEVDLMKYPKREGGWPQEWHEDWPSHVVAANEDVRGAIYLTSLKFSLAPKRY